MTIEQASWRPVQTWNEYAGMIFSEVGIVVKRRRRKIAFNLLDEVLESRKETETIIAKK